MKITVLVGSLLFLTNSWADSNNPGVSAEECAEKSKTKVLGALNHLTSGAYTSGEINILSSVKKADFSIEIEFEARDATKDDETVNRLILKTHRWCAWESLEFERTSSIPGAEDCGKNLEKPLLSLLNDVFNNAYFSVSADGVTRVNDYFTKYSYRLDIGDPDYSPSVAVIAGRYCTVKKIAF